MTASQLLQQAGGPCLTHLHPSWKGPLLLAVCSHSWSLNRVLGRGSPNSVVSPAGLFARTQNTADEARDRSKNRLCGAQSPPVLKPDIHLSFRSSSMSGRSSLLLPLSTPPQPFSPGWQALLLVQAASAAAGLLPWWNAVLPAAAAALLTAGVLVTRAANCVAVPCWSNSSSRSRERSVSGGACGVLCLPWQGACNDDCMQVFCLRPSFASASTAKQILTVDL